MTLKEEKDKFILVAKRILKKDLSKDPNTLSTYYADIVSAYNSLITYITDNFNVVNPDNIQEKLILFEQNFCSVCKTFS